MRLDLRIRTVSFGILLPAVLLSAAGLAILSSPARADLPTTGPVFTNPTVITNPYFPVSPGAVKVYVGRDGGRKITMVETHRAETRTFRFGTAEVDCRIVDSITFVGGEKIERERRYLAQADDGSVYCFGETDEDEKGDKDEKDDPDGDEPNGWVVGQLAAADPPDAIGNARPTVWMPADPDVNDEWVREEHPPFFDEHCRVRARGERVRTPSGRYFECVRLRLRETTDGTAESAWYAPGTGLVRVEARNTRLKLQASTLR